MPIRRKTTEDASINLTPMIDVVFLLVIFFMVGSEFSEAESRIEVNVPNISEMQAITRIPDERVVGISIEGLITLDDQIVSIQELTDRLRVDHANYPDLRVAVRGEASGSLQQTVEVLHAVRSSGVEKIGISTQRMQR